MPAYTNMAWPEDPYGTGQLWRQEPHLLAGFELCWISDAAQATPVSYAVTYLRLHRTRPVDLTCGFSFGFRAVVATTADETAELVRTFDLDVLRARRLAKIVAACSFASALHDIDTFAVCDVGRGIRGLAAAWEHAGGDDAGLARIIDIADIHAPAQSDLAVAAASVGIAPSTAIRAFASRHMINAIAATAKAEPTSEKAVKEELAGQEQDIARSTEWLGAYATERSLICAITAGRMLERHTWDGPLNIGEVMAANTWDCFAALDVDEGIAGMVTDPADRVTRGAT